MGEPTDPVVDYTAPTGQFRVITQNLRDGHEQFMGDYENHARAVMRADFTTVPDQTTAKVFNDQGVAIYTVDDHGRSTLQPKI